MKRVINSSTSPVLNQLEENFRESYQKALRCEIENDFLKSDLCPECGGIGFFWRKFGETTMDYQEQCGTCEELHQQEITTDRLHDEMKGN